MSAWFDFSFLLFSSFQLICVNRVVVQDFAKEVCKLKARAVRIDLYSHVLVNIVYSLNYKIFHCKHFPPLNCIFFFINFHCE